MKPTLKSVLLSEVDANPHRRTGTYPYVERKITALTHSYKEVGMWEGVVGRQRGNRVEISFGHHRVETARRMNMKEIPIILRDLSDREMLQFMGRENLEDFNADFLCMLETWEAGARFLSEGKTVEPVEIARLLGWMRDGGTKMSNTADACRVAHKLIEGGHLARKDLADMPVSAARELCARLISRIEMVEKAGQIGGRPAPEIAKDKAIVAEAGKQAARGYREGTVARKNIGQEVDQNVYAKARDNKRVTPLFPMFGKILNDQIRDMLANDNAAAKLRDMAEAIAKGLLTLEADFETVRYTDHALEELSSRAQGWRSKLAPAARNVTPGATKLIPIKGGA